MRLVRRRLVAVLATSVTALALVSPAAAQSPDEGDDPLGLDGVTQRLDGLAELLEGLPELAEDPDPVDTLVEVARAASLTGPRLPADLQRGVGGPVDPLLSTLAGDGCDPTDELRCLLPFPNDRYTTPDDTTPTGLRVDLDLAAMPRNVAGVPIRPDELNRNDGFSPGALILTHVAGLDLLRTFGLRVEDVADGERDAAILRAFGGDLGNHRGAEVSDLDDAAGLLEATRGPAQLRVPELSLADDAPIVLLNADRDQRRPYHAELDEHVDTPDDQRLLAIRPLRNLEHGERYVVALRDLRDVEGQQIEAGEAYADLRDQAAACLADDDEEPGPPDQAGPPDHAGPPDGVPGTPPDRGSRPAWAGSSGHTATSGPGTLASTIGGTVLADAAPSTSACDDPEVQRHTRILADLDGVVDPEELVLAWDFTVASKQNLAGRAMAVRDQALAMLGDERFAGEPDWEQPGDPGGDYGLDPAAGDAPAYEITDVEQRDEDVAIRGTITVPSFLTLPQDLPRVPPDELEEHLDTGVQQYVPGSRLHYGTPLPGPMDPPRPNPVTDTMQAEFACFLPNQADADDRPARPTLYGHGLLGGLGEVGGGSTSDLRSDNHLICGTPWIGMSTEDVANVVTILADMGNFATLPDRAIQGFVNFMYLGRLMAHDEGFRAHEDFQDDDGRPRISQELVYDGNSQGGIMGGALAALSPDIERAVLGVPGGNYSTLLNRSVDWEGAYGDIAYLFYPDKADQQLLFSLIQMLWDRAETNGYLHALGDQPLPRTPETTLLFQLAYADHQVANVAAEIDARTIGAVLLDTSLADARHWADLAGQRGFELDTFTSLGVDETSRSTLMYVDSGNLMPPHGNVPPTDGSDPHGDPRSDANAHDQRVRFLADGVIRDVTGGEPYWDARECRGPNNPVACDEHQPWPGRPPSD